MTDQQIVDKYLIFEAIRGSKAYGTNIEGSDEDIVGIYIQPDSDLTGLRYIPQISSDDGNAVYYELRRFYELAMEGNPNIMEVFNTPEDCVLLTTPQFEVIKASKYMFLTQNLFNSFANYARSQIKKARGFNKKMNWEMDRVKRKRVGDFCYVLKGENREDSISLSFFLRMSEIPMNDIGLAKVNNFPETYAMYRLGEGMGGIFTEKSNDVQLRSIPKDAQFLDYMRFDKNAYSMHCKDYKEYSDWLEKRNVLRYTMNLEHGKGYDCYLDSETEYLTDKGWKKFDDIDNTMKLGTTSTRSDNPQLWFEKPIASIDTTYTGDIYTYEDRYSKFSVTENHNLLLSKFKRSNTDKKSIIYNKDNSKWELTRVKDYVESSGQAHYLSHLKQNKMGISIYPEWWWLMAGAYIGDGHIHKKYGKVYEIRISQNESKELSKYLEKYSEGRYNSKITKSGKNYIYYFRDKSFIEFITKNFGIGTFNKKIPIHLIGISDNSIKQLLKGLMLSDGTAKDNSDKVYYSSNEGLIDDLQLLLINNEIYCQKYSHTSKSGYETKESKKFQLHIPSDSKKTLRVAYKKNFVKREVTNERVTCFEMRTGILITRNSDKIAIQGNSKNMMHCIRLINTAIDIATKREIVVRRPPEEIEVLLSIRRGEMEYDDLLAMAEEKILIAEKAFEEANLPMSVNPDVVHILINQIRQFNQL